VSSGPDFLATLARAARDVGVQTRDVRLRDEVPQARRRTSAAAPEAQGSVLLTESEGVLRWGEPGGFGALGGRRAAGAPVGRIVGEFRFETLAPAKVGEYLEHLDRVLTPVQGLRRLRDDVLEPVEDPPRRGRVLLLVHGTFSTGDNLVREIRSTEGGRRFLERAAARYDEVLAFDHPTLSVPPLLNALDLARAFAGSKARADVIAHSRGGIVARWWLEALRPDDAPAARAVLVGSPLAGTSLAAPPRLRAALDLLTNIGRALTLATATAAMAFPFLSLAAGLVRVLASISRLGARTPLLDAGVALVPGLLGQSRVGNNAELLRLRRLARPALRYFAVRSRFESDAQGWQFWRRFCSTAGLAEMGADLVFEGPSDLVVDTASMADLADGREIADVHDFGPADGVHHTAYFRRPETLDFAAAALEIP
jgi:hypothetical protein